MTEFGTFSWAIRNASGEQNTQLTGSAIPVRLERIRCMVIFCTQVKPHVNSAGLFQAVSKTYSQRYCDIEMSTISSCHRGDEKAPNAGTGFKHIHMNIPTILQSIAPSPLSRGSSDETVGAKPLANSIDYFRV